ncbi:MAG: YggS family pyridoxal phosphate-dependent enzyme [Myxococcales bacterium]|nr:YggS family pyridoxal phosphate-dependent enzyme [Myxococcales bacterium]
MLARVAAATARRVPEAQGAPPPRLIGVSKRHSLDAIRELRAAGLRDFGENYAQEFQGKHAALAGDDELRWHFIGALQTNKVKLVVGHALIHTVDRARLLDAIERRARALGVTQRVLVELQLAPEEGKAGLRADELPALLDRFAACERVRCCGLMIIPPPGEPEETRPYFAELRRLRDRLAGTPRANVELRELSMGMSADFEIAIEEGATLIRVGTALFGSRPR